MHDSLSDHGKKVIQLGMTLLAGSNCGYKLRTSCSPALLAATISFYISCVGTTSNLRAFWFMICSCSLMAPFWFQVVTFVTSCQLMANQSKNTTQDILYKNASFQTKGSGISHVKSPWNMTPRNIHTSFLQELKEKWTIYAMLIV